MTHSISFCSAVASDWLVLRIKIIKASLGSLVITKSQKRERVIALFPATQNGFMWLSAHVIPILGDPRSGQSGREKRRRKFLRTGERALDTTLNEPVPRLI